MPYSVTRVLGPLTEESGTDQSVPELDGAGLLDPELVSSIQMAVPCRMGQGIDMDTALNIGTWGRLGMSFAGIRDPNGGYIEVLRSGIVRTFLDRCKELPRLKFLVMADNDESIPWDAPLRLAQHNLPVVSGVVCGFSSELGIFACFTVRDKNGIERFPSFLHTKRMPDKGLVEAAQVGTGLICIRRDVLETLIENNEYPFYIPEEIRKTAAKNGNLKKGEDIVFSEQCEKYGFKRYVDLSVRAPHWKTIPLSWPQDHLDPNLSVEDWHVSVFDKRG